MPNGSRSGVWPSISETKPSLSSESTTTAESARVTSISAPLEARVSVNVSVPISRRVPSAKGTRLEIGTLTFTLTLASSGAEMLVTLADSAVVVDSDDSDGFVSEMLGHTPLRLPFGIVVGYSSSRGLVLEGAAPPAGTPAQPTALSGSGNVGPPVIAATIPIGRAFGPVTVHEVSIRLTRGPADAAPKDLNQSTFEADTSFSVWIGPVYLRLDQLGLTVTLDGSKPPEER